MFSKACEYALKAVLYLSLNSSEDRKLGIKEIAEKLNLPSPFLGKILQNLVRHKILDSTKGPNGGFYFKKNSKKIFIIKIVEIIDGLEFFEKCGMGLKHCSSIKPCPIHNDLMPYRQKLKEMLEEKTIADLTLVLASGKAFLKN
ncbi:MAG: Rrf2 family transcriptional regulator [Bacteroidetes bacterium RIFCSPLOWO2_12_FULL_35_15]|nr:MAG: Rrf2 family transcriptional regulator [Bacteroidetes bacterium RIFCSPLOWO2_12_FULL_35_15]